MRRNKWSWGHRAFESSYPVCSIFCKGVASHCIAQQIVLDVYCTPTAPILLVSNYSFKWMLRLALSINNQMIFSGLQHSEGLAYIDIKQSTYLGLHKFMYFQSCHRYYRYLRCTWISGRTGVDKHQHWQLQTIINMHNNWASDKQLEKSHNNKR